MIQCLSLFLSNPLIRHQRQFLRAESISVKYKFHQINDLNLMNGNAELKIDPNSDLRTADIQFSG